MIHSHITKSFNYFNRSLPRSHLFIPEKHPRNQQKLHANCTYEAEFTSECEQNTNVNAACENDAYVYVGKFVHCSAFTEAANRPCSQAVRSLMQTNWQRFFDIIAECKKKWRQHLNVSYANFFWSTDIWRIAFGCLPNVHRTVECCLPRLRNTFTSNVRIVFACRVHILFAFRCKRGLKPLWGKQEGWGSWVFTMHSKPNHKHFSAEKPLIEIFSIFKL